MSQARPQKDGDTLIRAYVETDPPIVWENPYRDLPIGSGADDIGRTDILTVTREAILNGGKPAYGAALAGFRGRDEILGFKSIEKSGEAFDHGQSTIPLR